MKIIQILIVGILAFALNAHAGSLESEVRQIRQILSDAESQRRTAEFRAHINAGFQQAADYHAQQQAKREARLAEPLRVVVVAQPTVNQPASHPLASPVTSEEFSQIQAMFAAIKNSGADYMPELLHEAVYNPFPHLREKARKEVFRLIRLDAREQPKVTARRELTEDERGQASLEGFRRFAVERGYQIDPALLHKATYSKNPAIRKKAREAIFKTGMQQLDERARKGIR